MKKRERLRDFGAALSRGGASTEDEAADSAARIRARNSRDDTSWLRYLSSLPEDAVAIIEPLEAGTGHPGRARKGKWRLRFEGRKKPFVDHFTGWTGGEDPVAHLELHFPSRSAAELYCERIALSHQVHEPEDRHPQRVNKQHFELEPPARLEGWPDKSPG